tara:strand:+ start:538 stop:1134 length:597 start_codon:yes stop_codon:yes gene_type:complete
MNKLTKIMTVYIFGILFSMMLVTIYHNTLLNNDIIPNETIIGISIIKTTDLPREKIFTIMTDIKNYTKILPNNVLNVNIINQTKSDFISPIDVIFVEEKISERGVMIEVIAKHDIEKFTYHKIEVMNGDAKGTVIEQRFEDIKNGTKISTEIKIHIKGILAPFGFLATSNLESAVNSVLDAFIEYPIQLNKDKEISKK